MLYRLSSGDVQGLLDVLEHVDEGCRQSVALRFTTAILILRANPDDDTIEASIRTRSEPHDYKDFTNVTQKSPWQSLRGKAFGWGWIATNQQGCADGILLSFGGIVPNILLYTMASSIEVYAVAPP